MILRNYSIAGILHKFSRESKMWLWQQKDYFSNSYMTLKSINSNDDMGLCFEWNNYEVNRELYTLSLCVALASH
jgi:hypothetical protein